MSDMYITCLKGESMMMTLKITDFKQTPPGDDVACLEWLKAKLYPEGIECRTCKKVTKHHKVSRRHCYVCDNCGNHLYPTAGTIFHKSNTPLNIWFKVIRQMQKSHQTISAREIQKEYRLSYKRADHMVKKVREFLAENGHNPAGSLSNDTLNISNFKNGYQARETKHNLTAANGDADSATIYNYRDLNVIDTYEKNDRIARLLYLQMLLWRNSQGLKIEEIAQKLGVSKKTVYRDLRTLEVKLNIPLWEERSRRGIVEGYFLPSINLSTAEAMNIFLAVRMMSHLSSGHNPGVISTYMKLSTIVPEFLRKHIQCTLGYIEKRPKSEKARSNFDKLTNAWLFQHRIRIRYQEFADNEPEEYLIEPYFIEPVSFIHSCLVIAYCPAKESILAFNLDNIVGDVMIETATYQIPADFDPVEYLGSAWGIQGDNEMQVIKLHIKSRVDKFLFDLNINSSLPYNEVQKDGSVIATLKVRDINHFCRWMIKFYDELEVLEPPMVRSRVRKIGQGLVKTYQEN
jgi:predicted DNA-binding transcriptional regulator YafY